MAPRKGSRSSKTDHVLSLLSHPSTPEPQQPAKQAANEKAPEETLPHQLPRETLSPITMRPRGKNAVSPHLYWKWPGPTMKPWKKPFGRLWKAPWRWMNPKVLLGRAHSCGRTCPCRRIRSHRSTDPRGRIGSCRRTRSRRSTGPCGRVDPYGSTGPHRRASSHRRTAPAEEPAPAKEPAPAEEPISNKLPTPEEAALIKPEEILPDESRFVNVMLPLVEEKLLKYVRMFHLCECPRCLADVKALALSHLPSKYVVLEGSTYTPMMSFYQAKFDSDVTAQVIHACKQVMEAPRHGKIPGLEKETH